MKGTVTQSYFIDGIVLDLGAKTVIKSDSAKEYGATDSHDKSNGLPCTVYWVCPSRGHRHTHRLILSCPLPTDSWTFRSKTDEDCIHAQLEETANRFVLHHKKNVTILLRCPNVINRMFSDMVSEKTYDSETILGGARGMTTEEIYEIVTGFGSWFRQMYNDEEDFDKAHDLLCDDLDRMNRDNKGKFSREFISDEELRNVVDNTLMKSDNSLAKFANKMTGRDILIINDTIRDKNTVDHDTKIINETYNVNSITVITIKIGLI